MKSQTPAPDASVLTNATDDSAERTLHIGTRNAAGLFYAACSRDYGEELCGCPICQAAAHDHPWATAAAKH
jgi:hypothetical protein